MFTRDPKFWRAGAVSTIAVMLGILAFLTVNSLGAMGTGGANVPPYTVINRHIGYSFDANRGTWVPTIGGPELLFGKHYSAAEASALVHEGKLVIQSRACMDCHTFFGNGAYYAPNLTKAWLDPAWADLWMPFTRSRTKADAMTAFLMHSDRYVTWTRTMPNLDITQSEARATVAYLKWLSSIDTNGFPNAFGRTVVSQQ
jgi:nitric oxide reductase subunit C